MTNADDEEPSIISRDEMQAPRRASDMLDWVNQISDRLAALPSDLIEGVRLKRFGTKQYFEEAKPIARFSHSHFGASSDVTIRHILGNQNYDAEVADYRECPGPVRFIEVTRSLDGAADALRNELLNATGTAPAFGHIQADGPRGRRGAIRAENRAHSHDNLRAAELSRIRDVVGSKASKTYPEGTALVVLVSDRPGLSDPADLDVLDAFVKSELLPLVKGFVLIAIVGEGGLYREYSAVG